MENNRIYALVIGTVAASVTGCASSNYLLAERNALPVCSAVLTDLQTAKNGVRSGYCGWRYIPAAGNRGGISAPDWKPFDMRKHPEYAMQIATLRSAYFNHKSMKERRDLWRGEKQARWEKDVASGSLVYYTASFDLDNDGDLERAILVDRADCKADWNLAPAPTIYVVGKNGQVDDRYGVWSDGVAEPFFFHKRTYLAIKKRPNPVTTRLKGPPGWSERLSISEPGGPSINTPFMMRKPICNITKILE